MQAWQNPCFRAADSDIVELEIDRQPNIVPKEITADMLQRLRVFQQLDRKFIAAVAGDSLVIIDQVRRCAGAEAQVGLMLRDCSVVLVDGYLPSLLRR